MEISFQDSILQTVVELPVVENPEQQDIKQKKELLKTLPNTGSEGDISLDSWSIGCFIRYGLISLAQKKKSEEE